MNLSDEIRKQIEKNKGLKLAVGEINNHLSILEGMLRADYQKQVDEAYQRGYDKGYADKTNNYEVCNKNAKDIQDEAYQRGLDDAWEAARKVVLDPDEGGMNLPDLFATFGITSMQRIFREFSASEAITKQKAYEEKQKEDNDIFNFGDEIIDSNGVKGCVVSKGNEGLDTMYALFDDCRVPQFVTQSNYRKTGRHFDIDKILEEIRA